MAPQQKNPALGADFVFFAPRPFGRPVVEAADQSLNKAFSGPRGGKLAGWPERWPPAKKNWLEGQVFYFYSEAILEACNRSCFLIGPSLAPEEGSWLGSPRHGPPRF